MLRRAGFRLDAGVWRHPSGVEYPAEDVARHHARVAADLAAKKLTGALS